jgi:hypothetical protein
MFVRFFCDSKSNSIKALKEFIIQLRLSKRRTARQEFIQSFLFLNIAEIILIS